MFTTAEDLRDRFSQDHCIERALKHSYACCVKYRRHRTLATEPEGVESITLRFSDSSHRTVFVVHCYLRPTGELGASGLVDPKYMLDAGGQGFYVN